LINLLEEQLKARREKRAFALVTLVKTQGTTPRSVGSKMLVFEDGSIIGTIGGGVLERQAAEDALRCIKSRSKELREYENRSPEPGAACGGTITAYIEADEGVSQLVVCGAGHVGGCLIKLAALLQYHVTAIDTRQNEMIEENVREADRFVGAESFYEGIRSLDVSPGAYYLVSTYGHAQDAEALAAVLEKEAAYIGMLGSPGKISAIYGKLREKGFCEEAIASIHAPVGLHIGGESPMEIAVSIMAEMQMVRYSGSGRPLKSMRQLQLI